MTKNAPRISIVDYGVGNISSIANMLAKIGEQYELVDQPEHIVRSSKIILPGVGAFDTAAQKLKNSGIGDAIKQSAAQGTPILGVCLGMQLLLDSSEEGILPGLGLIAGRAKRFPEHVASESLRVPHMGWNTVKVTRQSALVPSLGQYDRYYFVHSYYAAPADSESILGTTHYGLSFASVIAQGNILGAQFHPEKSHRFGLRFLSDFCKGK